MKIKVRLSLVCMLSASIMAGSAFSTAALADEVSRGDGSTSWSQGVEVAVPPREQLLVFTSNDLPNDGLSAETAYETRSSQLKMHLVAVGVGRLMISDSSGNVLWNFDKITPEYTTYTPEFTLPDGVGLYELIASLVDINDPDIVFESLTRFVNYVATPITPIPYPSPSPSAPNTGYLYFGNIAVRIIDVIVLLAGLSGAICFVVWRRRTSNRQRSDKTT